MHDLGLCRSPVVHLLLMIRTVATTTCSGVVGSSMVIVSPLPRHTLVPRFSFQTYRDAWNRYPPRNDDGNQGGDGINE